jgi:hypothetical protein
MGKKTKIIIGAVLGAVFVIIGIPLIVLYFAPGAMPANADSITGISQFFVLSEGNLYNVKFSLVDSNNAVVTSDASVKFIVTGGSSNPSQVLGKEIYRQEFDIKSADFQTYEQVLTGQPITAYAWQIDKNNSLPPPFNTDGSYIKAAYLNVTLPNNKTLTSNLETFF